jgi:hypothetical protein
MDARSRIRRMALVCASALVILPLTAVPATAQSAEDCDQFAAIPGIGEQVADGCRQLAEQAGGDDDGDEPDENGEDGPTGTPLDQLLGALDEAGLSPDELCDLRDEAPEQFDPVLEGLGVVIDEICPPEEEEEEEEPEHDPGPAPLPEGEEADDTTDADPSGDLPVTGGAAGLLGLGLLGAGVGLRRLRREGGDLG